MIATVSHMLSDNELDAANGGKDDLVVCVKTRSFSVALMNINIASCANGETIVYPTFD